MIERALLAAANSVRLQEFVVEECRWEWLAWGGLCGLYTDVSTAHSVGVYRESLPCRSNSLRIIMMLPVCLMESRCFLRLPEVRHSRCLGIPAAIDSTPRTSSYSNQYLTPGCFHRTPGLGLRSTTHAVWRCWMYSASTPARLDQRRTSGPSILSLCADLPHT